MNFLRKVAETSRVLFFLGIVLLTSAAYTLLAGTRAPDNIPSLGPILHSEEEAGSSQKLLSLVKAQDRLVRKLNGVARVSAQLTGIAGVLALMLAGRVRRERRDCAKRES